MHKLASLVRYSLPCCFNSEQKLTEPYSHQCTQNMIELIFSGPRIQPWKLKLNGSLFFIPVSLLALSQEELISHSTPCNVPKSYLSLHFIVLTFCWSSLIFPALYAYKKSTDVIHAVWLYKSIETSAKQGRLIANRQWKQWQDASNQK